MSGTAQNPNTSIDDIWSLPGSQQPVGKPGLANGGEGGGDWESDTTAQELLDKARQEEARRNAEVFKAPETLVSPEVGEQFRPAEIYKPKEDVVRKPEAIQIREPLTEGKIVDQRTGKKLKTHRVAEVADKVTQAADIKEMDFIENVEKIHSLV